MSDIADFTLIGINRNYVLNAEEQALRYLTGEMSDVEAIDMGIIEHPHQGRDKEKSVCKYCGEEDLNWKMHKTGVRLFKDDVLHICRVNKVICKYCDEDGLAWVEVKDAVWRLYNNDAIIHFCKSVQPPEEDTKPRTCGKCEETDLSWVKTPKGWKLYKGFDIHECKRKQK